jgi:hypothetical protein
MNNLNKTDKHWHLLLAFLGMLSCKYNFAFWRTRGSSWRSYWGCGRHNKLDSFGKLQRCYTYLPVAMELAETEMPAAKRNRHTSDHIVLNVGCEKFETTLDTLNNFPESLFNSLASGRHRLHREDDGSIFFDLSPRYFYNIIQYLRNGIRCISLPQSEEARDELLLEANYYSLNCFAARLRKFKLLDSQGSSFTKTDTGSAWYLAGFRHGAALFDVENPDDFEVTFRGHSRARNADDDWSDLYLGTWNATGVFVVIVPIDVDLSAGWEALPNPLPPNRPGAPAGGELVDWWPQQVLVPPALRRGFCCVSTVCFVAPEHEYDADTFLTQFVSKSELVEPTPNHFHRHALCPQQRVIRLEGCS